MEPNISPGPWRIEPDIGEAVLDRDGYMVADCAIFSSRRDWADRQGSNEANAKAICALPELIAYVKAAAKRGCGEARDLLAGCGHKDMVIS